jgi:hypothetical protein
MEQVQQVLRGDLTALERVASQIIQVITVCLFNTNKENVTHKRQYKKFLYLKNYLHQEMSSVY